MEKTIARLENELNTCISENINIKEKLEETNQRYNLNVRNSNYNTESYSTYDPKYDKSFQQNRNMPLRKSNSLIYDNLNKNDLENKISLLNSKNKELEDHNNQLRRASILKLEGVEKNEKKLQSELKYFKNLISSLHKVIREKDQEISELEIKMDKLVKNQESFSSFKNKNRQMLDKTLQEESVNNVNKYRRQSTVL